MSYFFSAGNNVNKTRKLLYNAVYNQLRQNISDDPTTPAFFYPSSAQQKSLTCDCNTEIFTSTIANPSLNIPKVIRVSGMLKNYTYYGKVQYANASAGVPIYVNYLGRTPGQPGGGGMPPKNRLL
jgi:O-acetylhomoserine/O-acetylserine sulfhydrylase-like pyridoxal-dependent enzyme